jgi:hypothetical protein
MKSSRNLTTRSMNNEDFLFTFACTLYDERPIELRND